MTENPTPEASDEDMKLETILQFFAKGIPAPGGSKRAFVPRRKDGSIVTAKGGRVVVNIVDDAGKRNKEWRRIVAIEAGVAMRKAGVSELDEALIVLMEFLMPRPQNHFGTKAGIPYLKDSAPQFHTQKPDALKLSRSTEDAMTGVVWRDDAANVLNIQFKRWAEVNENPGCAITIYRPIPSNTKSLAEALKEIQPVLDLEFPPANP